MIPAYNESRLLPRLLDTVDAARDRFENGRAAIEVIVSDNSSTDATAAIACARGCKVALVSQRMIAVGGYDETKHCAEDVDFLWKLIRLGRSRGQTPTRLHPIKAVVSARKFDRHGDWHYVWLPYKMLWSVIRERRWDSRDVRQYWYEDR